MRQGRFDPEIAMFGTFTGIDMNAEARKKTTTAGAMTGDSAMR
jgi:hypothetical protein